MKWSCKLGAFSALVAGLIAPAGLAEGKQPHRASPYAIEPPEVETTRAFRYAALSSEACLAELKARGVPFEVVSPTRNVTTPIRFTDSVRGVWFHPMMVAKEHERAAPVTIADCRLALAVDDLAAVLHDSDVVEAVYLSMYRPPGKRGAGAGRRHPAALAMDLSTIKLKSGKSYSVPADFHGRIGGKTCGDHASKPTKATEGAELFRKIACELGEKRSFNLLLTPNHDWAHRDHFHMEVRTGIRWYLIQ